MPDINLQKPFKPAANDLEQYSHNICPYELLATQQLYGHP